MANPFPPPTRTATWLGLPRIAWVAAAVFVGLLLPKIGGGTLWHHDELLSANRAREMLVRGDPFAVTVNFAPSVKKPPLQYWLCAGLLSLLPRHPELAVRLPTLLAGAACLLAAVRLADAGYPGEEPGERQALWTVLALGSCGYLIHFARVALLDTGAALLLTLALVGCRRARRDARWWWFTALVCVLGAWQKAAYGLAAWAVVLAVNRWGNGLTSEAHRPPENGRGRFHLPAAFALAVVGSSGWWLLQFLHEDRALLLNAGREQLGSFLRAHDPTDEGFRPWVYWGWLLRDWAGFGFCAPLAVLAAVRVGGREMERAGWGWTCAVFGGVLACLVYRAERYLVVITPLLAVLTINFLTRIIQPWSVHVRRWVLPIVLATALPGAVFQVFKPAPAYPELRAVARELGRTLRPGERVLVCTDAEPDFETANFVLFYAGLRRPLEAVPLASVEALPAEAGACRGVCSRMQWDHLRKARPGLHPVAEAGAWVLWAK